MAMQGRFVLVAILAGSTAFAADDPARSSEAETHSLRREVAVAMRRAATYYRTRVASHGGYVYYTSLDLGQRWGEGVASADQVWVQPPGTPAVGLAYLRAYEATGDRVYLDAAQDAAEALRYGQLVSGGWTNCIDFDPNGERVAQYRNAQGQGRGRSRGSNNSTLDDGISQAAIQFMLRMNQALDFKNREIAESCQVALDALLGAQFPNGGFPQVWTGPVAPRPIVKAAYPGDDWRTNAKVKNYWEMYTLNDGLAGTVSATLLHAFEVTHDVRFKAALARLGDFLILAQMPAPQPAWAQQYGVDMRPIWARKFEPAAISGGESQDVLETLLRIFRATGDPRYLEPVPGGLDYLKKSVLPDGRLARYYELRTNRPLYMTRQGQEYTLTYDDSDLPAHYGWKVESRLAAIEAQYQTLLKPGGQPPMGTEPPDLVELERRVRRIVRDLDDQGRWVSQYDGERLVGQPKLAPKMLYLSSEVFQRNLESMSLYLKATGGQGKMQ